MKNNCIFVYNGISLYLQILNKKINRNLINNNHVVLTTYIDTEITFKILNINEDVINMLDYLYNKKEDIEIIFLHYKIFCYGSSIHEINYNLNEFTINSQYVDTVYEDSKILLRRLKIDKIMKK